MIVIADSGPLRYLVVIEQIRLLPLLYGSLKCIGGDKRPLT